MALSPNKPYGEMSALASPNSQGLPFDFLEIRNNLFRTIKEDSACACKFDAPACSLEQRHADRLFQQTNLSAHRRLCYPQQGRSARKTQFVRNRDEIA